MDLRVPEVVAGRKTKCRVRGFARRPGERIEIGDCLAELRVEVDDGAYSDCPVVYFGDLVAQAAGVLASLDVQRDLTQGDVFATVGTEPGDFPLEFRCI
jgi:hypothetical protein